jgi:hypothetical protein
MVARLTQQVIVNRVVNTLVGVSVHVSVITWSIVAIWKVKVLALLGRDVVTCVSVVIASVLVRTIFLVGGSLSWHVLFGFYEGICSVERSYLNVKD